MEHVRETCPGTDHVLEAGEPSLTCSAGASSEACRAADGRWPAGADAFSGSLLPRGDGLRPAGCSVSRTGAGKVFGPGKSHVWSCFRLPGNPESHHPGLGTGMGLKFRLLYQTGARFGSYTFPENNWTDWKLNQEAVPLQNGTISCCYLARDSVEGRHYCAGSHTLCSALRL